MVDKAVAAVLTGLRSFAMREFDIPDIKPGEGLLRVEASGLCASDYNQYVGGFQGSPYAQFPMIPGHEVLGHVERLGAEAARIWNVKEGDRVVVEAVVPCGHCFQCMIGSYTMCSANVGYGLYRPTTDAPSLWGGYATHMYLHPNSLLHKVPDDIPADVMSLFNPLSNAVRWAYERPQTRMGESIVIEGPGQRGLMAVVVAREVGARPIIVTGTSQDKARLKVARALGAHHTIVVDEEDPVARVREITGGQGCDLVLDVSSATPPIVQGIAMLRRGGRMVLAGTKHKEKVKELDTDNVVRNEIQLIGVLSSNWTSTERAIDIIRRYPGELAQVCTHGFTLDRAEQAVLLLGRETSDTREAIHIAITPPG